MTGWPSPTTSRFDEIAYRGEILNGVRQAPRSAKRGNGKSARRDCATWRIAWTTAKKFADDYGWWIASHISLTLRMSLFPRLPRALPSRRSSHFASWKMIPTVWRMPDRMRLTPCRRLTR